MKYEKIEEEEKKKIQSFQEEEFGCVFCWDKKKNKQKELYFFDHANNLRLCYFCPNCGRKYQEVQL